MPAKNLCNMISFASSGPPPNLGNEITRTMVSRLWYDARVNFHFSVHYPICRHSEKSLTAVLGPFEAGLIAMILPLGQACGGSGSPPWGSTQRVSHDLGYRRAACRTSSRTWPHPIPTSPLPDRNHCPQEPEWKQHSLSNKHWVWKVTGKNPRRFFCFYEFTIYRYV